MAGTDIYTTYGPIPCDQVDLPDPCDTDQECIDEFGEGWYFEDEEPYWSE